MSIGLRSILPALAALVVVSCTDAVRAKPDALTASGGAATILEQRIPCVADVGSALVRCGDVVAGGSGASHDIILGNQGGFVKLTSSNVRVVGQVFTFDVTLENKLAQSIGTTDDSSVDPSGIKVFFASGPTVTSGTGTMDFSDPTNGGAPMYDGVGTFTGSNQPFYRYQTMLRTGWTTSPKTWRIRFDPTVLTFSFTVLVSAPTVNEQGYVTGHPHLVTVSQGEKRAIGGTVVTAAGTPVSGRTITYTSSDPANAPVDVAGVVTGGAARGTATITLQSGAAPALYQTVVNVCPTIPTIASGAHISGTLDPADCFAPVLYGGSPPSAATIADMFHVSLTTGQQITVTLASAASTGLSLVNPSGVSETPLFVQAPTINWIAQSTGVYTLEAQSPASLGAVGYTLDVSVSVPSLMIAGVEQGGVPVDLSAAAGVFDVSFDSPAAGTLDLFLAPSANCGSGTIAPGDSLVASEVVPANRVVPTVLTVNSWALNASTKPRFLNGGYCLKSRLTSGSTTVVAPTVALTLANASRYSGVLTYTLTSAIGPPYFDSPQTGLRYYQGDLTVVVTPVDYSGAATSIASLSLTLGGANKTIVLTPAPGTQTFTGTFGSAASTPTASSIHQYFTTSASGDALSVTAATDGNGQPVSIAGAVGVTRVDNASPAPPTLLNGGNGLPPSNWVNGTFSFLNTFQATGGTTDPLEYLYISTTFGVHANDASFVALPGGTSIDVSACSLTGWPLAGSALLLPDAAAGAAPTQYRLRIFEYDALGNVRCTDLPNPFGVDKEAPTLTVTGPADKAVIASGASMTTAFADPVSGLVTNSEVTYSDTRNWTTCVYGTTGNGCTTAQGSSIDIDNGSGVEAYYALTASSVDRAGNAAPVVYRTYLLDHTAPQLGAVTVPQNLVGGSAQTFSSTATDNVDLQWANFDIQYSALTGVDLYSYAQGFGPSFDASLTTSASVTGTVPFFIQQLQATTASGMPIPFAGADSGEATAVNFRVFDAANLQSTVASAVIPTVNISSSVGFTPGTELDSFTIPVNPKSVNNGAGTALTSVPLTVNAVLQGSGAQQALVPFTLVCFYYQQTSAGHAADPSIPLGSYVQINCAAVASILDMPAVSRTFTFTVNGWNPPASLGTAGTLNVIAIGINSGGIGLVSPVSTNITLVP
jgi:hypothetical protein